MESTRPEEPQATGSGATSAEDPPGQAKDAIAAKAVAQHSGGHPSTAGSAAQAERWRDHVIVAGLSSLGLRVVEQVLATGTKVVVVDEEAPEHSVRVVQSWGVPYVVGNARTRETLRVAGIAGAAALICMDDDDVYTLELALLSRYMRPDLRVVTSMTNEPVGRALQRVTGPGTVLDPSALAAPAFVDTLTRRKYREIRMPGLDLRIADIVAQSEGTLSEAADGMIPVASLPRKGAPHVCPSLTSEISPGDEIVVAGSPEQVRLALAAQVEEEGARKTGPIVRWYRALGRSRTGSISAFLHGLIAGADRALKATVLASVALIVLATIVIRLGYRGHEGEPMDAARALYTTVQTLVTVGYGDFAFGDQPEWLMIFDVALMLLGAFLFAILFAQITDLLVGRRLAISVGIERAAKMSDHTVIVGLSSVGVRVMRALIARGHDVVVIEKNPDNRFSWAAREHNVPLIVADATLPGTLAAANVAHASGAAVLTGNDLTNIETGLAIKDEFENSGRHAPVVLSMFDRYLSRVVEVSLGFREVRSTAQIAAPWFVAAALGLEIVTAFSVAKHNVLIGRLKVSATGGLVGLSEKDLGPGLRVLAQAVSADSPVPVYPPVRGRPFEAGDQAIVAGTAEDLLRVLAKNR